MAQAMLEAPIVFRSACLRAPTTIVRNLPLRLFRVLLEAEGVLLLYSGWPGSTRRVSAEKHVGGGRWLKKGFEPGTPGVFQEYSWEGAW